MVERTPRREVPRPLPIPRMHVDANSAARFSCFHGGTVIRFAGRPYLLASQEGLSSSKRAGCSSGDSHLLRVDEIIWIKGFDSFPAPRMGQEAGTSPGGHRTGHLQDGRLLRFGRPR